MRIYMTKHDQVIFILVVAEIGPGVIVVGMNPGIRVRLLRMNRFAELQYGRVYFDGSASPGTMGKPCPHIVAGACSQHQALLLGRRHFIGEVISVEIDLKIPGF